MTTVRNPKMMKSYHSSALPMTAAATWSDFGADELASLWMEAISSLDAAGVPGSP
jgi:hypothetical protein